MGKPGTSVVVMAGQATWLVLALFAAVSSGTEVTRLGASEGTEVFQHDLHVTVEQALRVQSSAADTKDVEEFLDSHADKSGHIKGDFDVVLGDTRGSDAPRTPAKKKQDKKADKVDDKRKKVIKKADKKEDMKKDKIRGQRDAKEDKLKELHTGSEMTEKEKKEDALKKKIAGVEDKA